MDSYGLMDGWHGDELELEYEAMYQREAYQNEHADDWKDEFDEDNYE